MGRFERVIPIHPAAASCGTGVADAMVREIAAALARYLRTGHSHVIDLTGMPLSEEDRGRLDRHLGRGELSMDIHALLHTHIEETRYAGVWRVRHYGADGAVQGERIEIIDVPEIARAATTDIERSVQRLDAARIEEGTWQTKP
ncbi:MAG: hydrogenase expression/formation protein [Gammaproteobacteria bacterium]|nr:hydrogenase expression/formation protein [Gammaproteobacteria bacterium]